ncbi:hypothetical protein AeRB84_004198 [Aphanomyces euteiches]|nr:hypothetical protein AeRB84_004198 [Aphanomyces euteiches]
MDGESRRYIKFSQRVNAFPSLKTQVLTVEVFQNQRRQHNKWHRKYLQDMPCFSCSDGSLSCSRFPKRLPPPKGYIWTTPWHPCLTQLSPCDENGWTYSTTFDQLFRSDNISGVARPTDCVRRRRWVRVLQEAFIPFEWKGERLGVSLIEPPNLTEQKCIEISTQDPLPMHLVPVGATYAAVVKRAPKEHLFIHAMLSKGDMLVRVNDVEVAHLPFHEIAVALETAFSSASTCMLHFAAAGGKILIHSCSHAAKKRNLRPGFQLVGINGRSVKHLRLVDVESTLRKSPRDSCVLYFQEVGAIEPPFERVHLSLLTVREKTFAPSNCTAPKPIGGTHNWLLRSRMGALFASSG